jgi:hypothetical protein
VPDESTRFVTAPLPAPGRHRHVLSEHGALDLYRWLDAAPETALPIYHPDDTDTPVAYVISAGIYEHWRPVVRQCLELILTVLDSEAKVN